MRQLDASPQIAFTERLSLLDQSLLVPRWLVRPGGAGASLADERLRAADLAELSDAERLAR